MAENLVSKFTVNSQGTDIDVKIKDEDARNLIAQEITDRSKLIKADENNNTVIATSNKLIEKSSDREINVNGTSAETYSGAVTRNYEQPVNETYSGVYNITSGDKKFNVIATHNFIFATDYGVSETSDDNSDKLNELLANNDCVVLPRGTYKFTKPIEIFRSGATVILIGAIQSTADWAIKIKGVNQHISSKNVTGTNNGIQILDGDVASGGSVFSFDGIAANKIGLELNCSHENSGIQTCNFYLNRISFGTIGIHFICSSNGNWINQNVFENFWCFPNENNTGTGIKMEKGPGQTDKFNQNHFDNFSCEACNTYVDLAYADKNYFNDFRAIENSGSRQLFKLASDTSFNIFRTSEHLHFSDLDDHGYSNIYNAVFTDKNNIPKTDKIILIDGWYYLCNGLTSKFAIIHTNTGLKLDDYFTKFVVDPTEDTVIVLSPTYGNTFTALPFWVETTDLKSHKVILELFSGHKLYENFEDWKKYLFTPLSNSGDYNVTVF